MNHLSKYKKFLKEFDDFKKEHEKKINDLFLDLLNKIEPIAFKIKDILDFYEAEGIHVRVDTHNWTVLSIRDDDASIELPEVKEIKAQEEFLSGEIYICAFFDGKDSTNIKKRIESEFSEELKLTYQGALLSNKSYFQYKVNILSLQ